MALVVLEVVLLVLVLLALVLLLVLLVLVVPPKPWHGQRLSARGTTAGGLRASAMRFGRPSLYLAALEALLGADRPCRRLARSPSNGVMLEAPPATTFWRR